MKKKKLNSKRKEVRKQLEENPKVKKKEFDDLLDKMIETPSKSGSLKQ